MIAEGAEGKMDSKGTGLFSVEDRVVIITGAGKGIGRAIALAMAEGRAFVYCVDISFRSTPPDLLKRCLFHERCDVTKSGRFGKLCASIFKKYGRIDVLVNNAGVTHPKEGLYDGKLWDKTIRVNLTAAFTCSQVCCEYMARNRQGSIINITSLNAERAFPNNPAYVASKGGLRMLGKALARDWGGRGIRVNNIGPGYMRTDITERSYRDIRARNARTANTMLGRWGEPEDLVGPCIFLASHASAYITGADIYVDGGWMANGLAAATGAAQEG